jgi:hypothetical protein|nr:MAG TPA: hypothetical protein [Caudoviricetes sp.]
MTAFGIIAIVVLVLLLVALVLFAGVIILRALPTALLQVGDKVEIFTDGEYNRTATITGVTGDRLFIYGTLPLPLDYRGRFYGIGTDIDGVDFWYLANRKHYFLVPFAERVRKMYRQLSYPFNLCPVTSEAELLTAAQRQKEESEKYQEETEVNSPGESEETETDPAE